MIRFLAHPTPAALLSDLFRRVCGVLGCTTVAGAISIGLIAPADAATRAKPEPHRSLPPICRYAWKTGDRYTAQKCKEAWLVMRYERSRSRSAGREVPRWMMRFDRKPKGRKRAPAPKRVAGLAARPRAPAAPSPRPHRARRSPPGLTRLPHHRA
jgi:hypothetical protein